MDELDFDKIVAEQDEEDLEIQQANIEEIKQNPIKAKTDVQIEYEANLAIFNKMLKMVPIHFQPPTRNACNTCSSAKWDLTINEFKVYCQREHIEKFESLKSDREIIEICSGNPYHTDVRVAEMEKEEQEKLLKSAQEINNNNQGE